MDLPRLWNQCLGKRMTFRLSKVILPDLVWNQEVYGERLKKYVSKDIRWLDAGCGWRPLGEGLDGMEDALVAGAGLVVGTDLTLASLAKHRNISRRVCASLEALPFADQSFDLITCNMVVEHLSQPERSLGEMTRLLSPRGVLLIHTPNKLNYLIMANALASKLLPRRLVLKLVSLSDERSTSDIFPTYYRANSALKLKKIIKSNNLRLESLRVLAGPQPYFRFFAPFALFELLWMRAIMVGPLQRFGATLLVAAESVNAPAAGLFEEMPISEASKEATQSAA